MVANASQNGRWLEAALRCSPHAVVVVVDDLVVVASEQARRLAGTAPTGLSLEQAGLVPAQRAGRAREPVGARQEHELWHGPDGGRRLVSWTDVPLPGGGLLVTGVDITTRDQVAAGLRAAATTDQLTGLMNRTGFLDRLREALEADPALVVLFCDLDGFKAVNDGYGHAAGDVVLRAVALRLRRAVRTDDVVARFGGDEFVVLARGMDAEGGDLLVKRLVRNVAQPIVAAPNLFTVGVTVGLAVGRAGISVEEVLQQADGEMYRAKTWRRTAAGRLGVA